MSDLSQDFRPADILGVLQEIKGFDKSDFLRFISTNHSKYQPIDTEWMHFKSGCDHANYMFSPLKNTTGIR